MALTVVFDTNILFSATGWRGNPFQCVEQARAGIVESVRCVELLEELAEKLELKLGFSSEQSAETLADYLWDTWGQGDKCGSPLRVGDCVRFNTPRPGKTLARWWKDFECRSRSRHCPCLGGPTPAPPR